MKPVLENWTIVILGKWNVSIFNPQWLTENIFKQKQLLIDFPMVPRLPPRITGDKVLLIPGEDRLIIGPTELEKSVLERMEEVAIKLLETLPHTPITKVGINFGYKVEPVSEELHQRFANPDASAFADTELKTLSKSFKWSCESKKQIINMNFDLTGNELLIKFNFHSDSLGAEKAKDAIKGKVLAHKEEAESILDRIYKLKMEEV